MSDIQQDSSSVSIGIPVHNGDRTLEEVLLMISTQTHRNLEIIISDNASYDRTEKICRRFAEFDSRIRFFRQQKLISPGDNFRFVFEKSTSEFFMWAADDDKWSTNYVEECVRSLQAVEEAVGCIGRVVSDSNFSSRQLGGEPIEGSTGYERFNEAIIEANGNSRLFSLFKRSAMTNLYPIDQTYLGADWILTAMIAAEGKLIRAQNDCEFCKCSAGESSSVARLFLSRKESNWEFLLPYYRLMKACSKTPYNSLRLQIHLICKSIIFSLRLWRDFFLSFVIKNR